MFKILPKRYENNFQSWAIFQRRYILSQSVQACYNKNICFFPVNPMKLTFQLTYFYALAIQHQIDHSAENSILRSWLFQHKICKSYFTVGLADVVGSYPPSFLLFIDQITKLCRARFSKTLVLFKPKFI